MHHSLIATACPRVFTHVCLHVLARSWARRWLAHIFASTIRFTQATRLRSIMIELKKHSVDNDLKEFSFKELWKKTDLDFDVFVTSKCIKRRIIESGRSISVKPSDEPFFEAFFKNDKQFILDILPKMNVPDGSAWIIVTTFSEQIMFRNVGAEVFDKLYGERVPLMYRIMMLIGAHEICNDDKYSSIYILRWFCARIIATILPVANIDEFMLPWCTKPIAVFLEKQFGEKNLTCCDYPYEPDCFMEHILYDDTLIDWITPSYLFHDNIFQLCLMSDPEAAVDKFMKENAAIIRVINRCEPLFVEYLPKNITYIIDRVIWRWSGYEWSHCTSSSKHILT